MTVLYRDESRGALAGGAVVPYLLLAATWVGLVSVLSMAMLVFDAFRPRLAVVFPSLLVGVIAWCFRKQFVRPNGARLWGLLAVALVAAVFRVDVYPHVMGGQDQGLYTNMAALLEREGRLNYTDELRAGLPVHLREIYDKASMPGISLIDPATSLKTIDFYPLHPVWMAIAKSFLGENRHSMSLLLFSALYLLSSFVLASRIFRSELAGWLAVILLAVNPTMAFFSKYPVTETVALGFSMSAFLFLLLGMGEFERRRRLVYLAVSVLMFNGYFYTRMQFLMLMPFFVLVALGVCLQQAPGQRRQDTLCAMLAILGLFVLSATFYITLQPTLALPMLGHFTSIVPGGWFVEVLAVAGIGTVGALYAIHYVPVVRAGAQDLLAATLRAAPYLLALALLAAVQSVLSFIGDGRMPPFPYAVPVGEDPWIFRYHISYRFILMASPVAAVILLMMWWRNFDWPIEARVLMLFLASCWLLQLLQPTIPYLYYYGRYLVGEILPYSIVLVAGALVAMLGRARRLGAVALLSMVGYSVCFALPQVGKIEGDDGLWFAEIKRVVNDGLVVLLDGDGRISTGLAIYQDLDVFPVKSGEFSEMWESGSWDDLVAIARSRGKNIWILMHGGPKRTGVISHEVSPFRHTFFSNGENLRDLPGIYNPEDFRRLLLPYASIEKVEPYTLYEIARSGYLDSACRSGYSFRRSSVSPLVGLSGFGEAGDDGAWTVGPRATFVCSMPEGESHHRAIIRMDPYLPPGHEQRVAVSVNGKIFFNETYVAGTAYEPVDIPLPAPDHKGRYRLEFNLPDAISPQQVGQSSDARALGVSVRSIRFLSAEGDEFRRCAGTVRFADADDDNKEDMLKGFGAPEPHGRWSLGSTASLQCMLPKQGHVERVEMDVAGFVARGHVQNVRVTLNGSKPVYIRLDETQPASRIVLPVPSSATGRLDILFELPDAISPMELTGTADQRRIAISLSAVSFH